MKQFAMKHSVILTLIPVLLVLLMIFYFSAEKVEDSRKTSGKIEDAVIEVTEPEFDTYAPSKQRQVKSQVSHTVRKIAHFVEFAALGFLLMGHLTAMQRRYGGLPLKWLWSWGIGTFFAVTDEMHQIFVSGRGPGVKDVLIDSSGVLAGTLAMMLLLWIFRTAKQENTVR